MTRTDALQWAAKSMLEQFRVMLDSTSEIGSVRLEMKITPDGKVRSAQIFPCFEAHPAQYVDVTKYDFEKKLLTVTK